MIVTVEKRARSVDGVRRWCGGVVGGGGLGIWNSFDDDNGVLFRQLNLVSLSLVVNIYKSVAGLVDCALRSCEGFEVDNMTSLMAVNRTLLCCTSAQRSLAPRLSRATGRPVPPGCSAALGRLSRPHY